MSVALLALWFGGHELPHDPGALASGLRRTLHVAALAEALGAILALRFVRRESLGGVTRGRPRASTRTDPRSARGIPGSETVNAGIVDA